jgi:hypothetical protein
MSLQSTRIPAYGPKDPIFGTAQPPIVSRRAPTTTDRAEIGSLWIDRTTEIAYLLMNIVAGASIWVQITAAGGQGFTWNVVTASQVMVPNNGYIAVGGVALQFGLPPTCPAGSVFKIVGQGTVWGITQNAGQQIIDLDESSTVGVGGGAESDDDEANDAIELVCSLADATFMVYSSNGNIDYI